MNIKKMNLYTMLFVGLFLTAGILHAVERRLSLAWNTLSFLLIFSIYAGLVVFWYISIRARLLPTRARQYVLTSAALMLFFLLLRTMRYRVFESEDFVAMQWSWYAYYVPFLFIPTLFLMTCILSSRGEHPREGVDERLLLLLPAIQLVLVITNEWHGWVFVPLVAAPLGGLANTYSYGFMFYVFGVITMGQVIVGLGLTVSTTRRMYNRMRALIPFGVVITYVLLMTLEIYLGMRYVTYKPYNTPELASFGAMAVFETCIRLRLFPYNDNFEAVWQNMQLPAVITDRRLHVRWRSALPLEAPEAVLLRAIEAPVHLDADTRISALPLSTAGYVFFAEDEGDLHRLDAKLQEVGRTIEEENTLIATENELREKRARMESRGRIYQRIHSVMQERQRRITAIIDGVEPDTPAFRKAIAEVLVRTTFVKRGANMLLSLEDRAEIPLADLALAMDESVRYLKYCNLHAGVTMMPEGVMDGAVMFDLYSTYEDIIEALLPACTRLIISVQDGVMRLSANCRRLPTLPPTALPVDARIEDGAAYFVVTFGGKGGKGGAHVLP